MSYTAAVCDCDNVGTLETLAAVSYSDDSSSIDAYPSLPSSLEVQITDTAGYCGDAALSLGEGEF